MPRLLLLPAARSQAGGSPGNLWHCSHLQQVAMGESLHTVKQHILQLSAQGALHYQACMQPK